MTKTVPATAFTVGWVCALPIELAAAGVMMDEEYDDLPQPTADTNIYTYGRVGVHNVVAACLPAGQMGTNQAAVVASQMRNSFPFLRFGVLVGIGGGVPSEEHDIRLGDVVISQPTGQLGGVVQFDFGKTGPDGRIARTGSLNAPPPILLNALAKLRANDLRGRARVNDHLSAFSTLRKFLYPGPEKDTLYTALSQHVLGPTCARCSDDDVVHRDTRDALEPALFFGNIGSGNQVMKDAPTRDRISQDLGGILCFEMEAAGLMNNFPCLVIRGICDYADAHKNKQWQPYAAATAAAWAKELLRVMPQVAAAGQETSQPVSHFMVPFGQNQDFVGREDILQLLLEKTTPTSRKNDCQRTVVEGLGGVGKTQIALEIAYRIYNQELDCSVFWVPAITLVTFENAYREIGQALGTLGIDDKKAGVKALVKAALEESATCWLLIIDSIDDIGLLASDGLQDSLPFNRKGSILFTTRNHEVAVRLDISLKNTFALQKMTEAEGIQMLQNGLKERQFTDMQSNKSLLECLTYLPLALKQASAYMARTGETTATYLKYYLTSNNDQIELLDKDFEDRWRYSKDTNPITMTWLISFQHLERSYPLAVQYLKFICLLAEKDIPIPLLPAGQDKKLEREAIGILEGYAFIAIREQGDSFDIHSLVRLVTRNWIKSEWEIHSTAVVQHLAQIYPFPEHENRQTWMRYMPHAETVLEVQVHCTDKGARARLFFVIANSYAELAKYTEAEQMHRQALELSKSVLGLDNPSTLDIMNSLASALNSQGKYEEAETMHRQTLELRQSLLGPDHVSTLDSMNNLAIVLNQQGRYDEAEQMLRQELELCRVLRGLEHLSTLNSMNNLASVLESQGKYEEAEPMHRQALELKKLVLGPESPSTLDSMNNLAEVLSQQGKYEEAEQMHRQTLELMESVLGPEHPSTLDSMSILALILDSQGKYEEAEQMHQQTFELKKSVLGPEHPSTLSSMNNLAIVLDKQGKYEEAEQMHRKELELCKSVLGPEHPSTLDSINNLAAVLRKQRKYDKAEQMHRQALELRKSVLGPEHPSTLDSMNNLAAVLRKQGKYEEAEQMHRQTLELRKSVLGPEHPSTLDSMSNLALVLCSQGKYEEAEQVHQQTLQLRESVLGPYHPSTVQSRRKLQHCLDAQVGGVQNQ